MMHIRERHPEAYIDTMHYVREILERRIIFWERKHHPSLVGVIKKPKKTKKAFVRLLKS